MPVLVDNAAARLSRRLGVIPEQLRAIKALVDPDRYPRLGRALPRRRLSTRHLMFLVAAVAVLLGAFRTWRDVSYRWRQAAFHEDMAAFHRGRWPRNMNRAAAAALTATTRRRPELAVFYSRMKVKWELAAENPWLPVEDDPPWMSPKP